MPQHGLTRPQGPCDGFIKTNAFGGFGDTSEGGISSGRRDASNPWFGLFLKVKNLGSSPIIGSGKGRLEESESSRDKSAIRRLLRT